VAPLSWLCCLIKISDVFYPRDYARAGTIVLWCVRVCPPVTSRCSVKSDEWINVFLAWGFLSTSHTLCFKESQVFTKIRVLACGPYF